MSDPWTRHMVTALVTMWGKHPTQEIANFIGVSKNAVIGRAGRMGLKNLAAGSDGTRSREHRVTHKRLSHVDHLGRERIRDEKRRNKAKADKPKRALRIVSGSAASNVSKFRTVRRVARMAVDTEPTRNLLIGELTRETCAFPTSTEPAPTHSGSLHKFCGCPVESGKMFCPGHMAIAFPKSMIEEKDIAA